MQLNSKTLIHLVLSGVLLCGCVPGNVPSKPVKADTLKDNLSDYRPKYEATDTNRSAASNKPTPAAAATGKPTGDITPKLNSILDTIATRNRSIRFAQGYRVQIYSGSSREEANRARDRSYSRFPDVTPHIVYTQPTFRVKVGDFLDRLEAQRVYAGLVAEFPNALIIPDRIEIR